MGSVVHTCTPYEPSTKEADDHPVGVDLFLKGMPSYDKSSRVEAAKVGALLCVQPVACRVEWNLAITRSLGP